MIKNKKIFYKVNKRKNQNKKKVNKRVGGFVADDAALIASKIRLRMMMIVKMLKLYLYKSIFKIVIAAVWPVGKFTTVKVATAVWHTFTAYFVTGLITQTIQFRPVVYISQG